MKTKFKLGDKVIGKYKNKNYSGIISHIAKFKNSDKMVFIIALDEPVEIFGTVTSTMMYET
jgi:hypothetical protein